MDDHSRKKTDVLLVLGNFILEKNVEFFEQREVFFYVGVEDIGNY